ncbi:Rpn family recombination-promoting nuclease/putative transposase [Flammeovirga yaeyamensis]|uniref:Rpn family recombination-promoting nuclease/putative transposase n=1 Tax=Flammeovirga yaeyamensis TaxID=367791 RepID=A0AAX1N8J5_9BACT|nr:Rpn family recombination-promoting nuclease/putative transposase [Flammeovirga yaeyamensis]MBB3698833.1 putative transposase/invertase (TIGR01784 family) [Flammeovirga yaeyamensis]NMF37418.1 Rpn family recombination-promoting nuclease/putative transposase [Flammeovirga yaeyamensis]QWG03769.1 Rpn family recombination-promoting nuclease/putative transposase [Flammeovirga yaeyamensis]
MCNSRYINPFTDFGFKKIFGEEANKDILIDFLNSVLPAEDQIYELNYKSTEHLPSNDTDRKAIYDLYCENELGEKFIVELQRAEQTHFKDRTIYYSSFPIQEQAKKGKGWDYELKAVYVISIMDFIFDENDEDFHHIVELKNQKNKVFYDKLKFVYLELPKFRKQENELKSNFDKWLYLLNNITTFEQMPTVLKEHIFRKVLKIAEYTALPKQDQEIYDEDLKRFRDYINTLDTRERRGAQKKAIETAKKILKMGLSIEQVAEATGLSIDEVKQLSENK